jgi:NAD(P)-dependent dehydrogenase (short-subunit alcohol dehydrogenase family)
MDHRRSPRHRCRGGRALAEAGARVWLSDVLDCGEAVEAIREAGGRAEGRTLDVRDREGCAALVAEVLQRDGRLDALVANAGVCPAGSVAGDWEQWHRVIDVNLHGTQNCVAAVWDPMRAQAQGCIVIVSSMAWYRGGVIVGTEYTASKAALVGMTRHLARNGGPLGIRCQRGGPGLHRHRHDRRFPAWRPGSDPAAPARHARGCGRARSASSAARTRPT